MADIVLDTNVFVELISNYCPFQNKVNIESINILSKSDRKLIRNSIDSNGDFGYIVVSVFTIIEITNQFDKISVCGERFTRERLLSLIKQPPDWLLIESINWDIAKAITEVPKTTTKFESMEYADSIHVATAISRGRGTGLIVTDHKIKDLNMSEFINIY